MYFSATTKTSGFHCIGAARSSTIKGPYDSVSDSPLVCPIEQGGAIDASGFRDADGKRYMVYKIDGNAIGSGGSCNNGVKPYQHTPIMLQQVAADGHTFIGEAKKILDRDDNDGPLVEGPAIVRYPGPKYVLSFSSQCYVDAHYSGSYAVSDSIGGDYVKAKFPLLVTGSPFNVWGPGHADIDWDGQHMAFHGYASPEAVGGRRYMYVARLSWDGERLALGEERGRLGDK